MNISVIGAGYVGLIIAAGFAKLGHKVICVDIDKSKVDSINLSQPLIYEKGLEGLLKQLVPARISATTDLKNAIITSEVIIVCVGTPSKKEGSIALHHLEKACADIGSLLKEKQNQLIIIKSTVVPGTTEELVIPTIEKHSGKRFGKDFFVVMSPEFLREGSALDDFFKPDRIVIGSTDQNSLKMAGELFADFDCPILEASFKEAEMIKYASNAFLATKLSFINEIGNVCKKLGVNTNKVALGIGLDHRIGLPFLRCGIGFGGSCFPKDISALIYQASELGYNARLLRAVLEVNRDQPLKLLELLEKIDDIRNKKIGILGLTFKAGTDDIRDSPAVNMIKELLVEQYNIEVFDPTAVEKVKKIFPYLSYAKSAQELINDSDIILILTEWPEFKELDYGNKLVIDGKNLFDDNKPKNYEGVCW